ncbi:MAG: hypothetical protein JKP92_08035 [Alphaproteobacteria bacterium]|jgi:hypothetical protein|nr:hypothetical protein [Alphaproteobacteria bacterium]
MFEQYTGPIQKYSKGSIVSLDTKCAIAFSGSFAEEAGLKNYKSCLLYFDKETGEVGIKFLECDPEPKNHTFRVRQRKNTGPTISAAAFCKYYGIKPDKVTRYKPRLEKDGSLPFVIFSTREPCDA